MYFFLDSAGTVAKFGPKKASRKQREKGALILALILGDHHHREQHTDFLGRNIESELGGGDSSIFLISCTQTSPSSPLGRQVSTPLVHSQPLIQPLRGVDWPVFFLTPVLGIFKILKNSKNS